MSLQVPSQQCGRWPENLPSQVMISCTGEDHADAESAEAGKIFIAAHYRRWEIPAVLRFVAQIVHAAPHTPRFQTDLQWNGPPVSQKGGPPFGAVGWEPRKQVGHGLPSGFSACFSLCKSSTFRHHEHVSPSHVFSCQTSPPIRL